MSSCYFNQVADKGAKFIILNVVCVVSTALSLIHYDPVYWFVVSHPIEAGSLLLVWSTFLVILSKCVIERGYFRRADILVVSACVSASLTVPAIYIHSYFF